MRSYLGLGVLAAGVGAGMMFLLDPQTGRRRRAILQNASLWTAGISGGRQDHERCKESSARNRRQHQIRTHRSNASCHLECELASCNPLDGRYGGQRDDGGRIGEAGRHRFRPEHNRPGFSHSGSHESQYPQGAQSRFHHA